MPKKREDLAQKQQEICRLFPQTRINDIAIKFNTSETTIRNILNKNGIKPKDIKKEKKKIDMQKDFGIDNFHQYIKEMKMVINY